MTGHRWFRWLPAAGVVAALGFVSVAAGAEVARSGEPPSARSLPALETSGEVPANHEEAEAARARLDNVLDGIDANIAQFQAGGDPALIRDAAQTRAALEGARSGLAALSDAQVLRAAGQLDSLPSVKLAPRAQSADRTQKPSAQGPSQDDVPALENVRAELTGLFNTYELWAPITGNDPQYLGFVHDGKTTIASLSYEDLAAIRDQLNDIPDWQHVLAPDLTVLLQSGVGGALPLPLGVSVADTAKRDDTSQRPDASAQPLAGLAYPGRGVIEAGPQCSDQALNYTYDQVVSMMIAETALRYGALALEFGAEILPKDIKLSFFIAGLSIPNPYTLLVLIGKLVVDRIADVLAANIAVSNYCTSVVHWKLTKLHAQSLLDRGQDILYQELEFHNRMTERENVLDHTQREFWKLQTQLALEEDLLQDAPVDGSEENRMAVFQFVDTACFNPEELLPAPLQPFDTPEPPVPDPPLHLPDRYVPLPTLAPFEGPSDPREQCGIELVRRIVAETILHNRQAGNNVHNAPAYLSAGDTLLAQRNFGQAYIRFRQAYQAAVKPDPEPTQ